MSRSLLLTVLFAAGCSVTPNEDETEAVAGEEDVGETGAMVQPMDGVWDYDAEGVQNNSCPDELVIADADRTIVLDYDGAASFEIEDGDADIPCDLDGDEFLCPDRLVSEFPVPELNLTLQVYIRIEGSFSTQVDLEGEQMVRVECVGEGCGAVGDTYPCAYDLVFTAEFQV